MNASQFMDKQIMDLSNSQNNNGGNDFSDLNNHSHQEHDHHEVTGGGSEKDEILPNYDFQPIRPLSSSQPSSLDSSNVGGTRVWSSADNSAIRNYGSLNHVEPAKVDKKSHDVYNSDLISEIDRTMKKHADNLMHALEGISARLSQLESRSRHLENSVDGLKASLSDNHGSTNGKLRQIENIVREVQAGVQVVKDKQEILEAQLQLSKVQISKIEQQPESQIHVPASAPLQSHYQPPPAASVQTPPPPATPQNLAPPMAQFPHNTTPISQHDSYYPPPSGQIQTPEAPPQQLQLPPSQQQFQPPQAAPPLPPSYQQPPQMQYSQPAPMPQQPPVGYHSEEQPYIPSQNYPPSIRQPSGGPPPSQLSYGYEPPSSRPGSGFSGQYTSSSWQEYGGVSSSPVKGQQFSSNVGPGGGSSYPQLPTARVLPHALPTASAAGGGGGSGNRVPIDDVVDKVTNMGFPRDQVRATVRKLTENGQAVDLNVVLDKLMTDGVESQGPRGWFGR